MKKIFKVTNWGNVAFTSANVLDKSHWFVKALDTALTALEIGTYSITYASAKTIVLTTDNYGGITLHRPQNTGYIDTTQPYIVYVDSEKKELLFCSQDGVARNPVVQFGSHVPYNCARGIVSGNTTASFSVSNGGGVRLKFHDGSIIGGSIENVERYLASTGQRNIAQLASPFHDNAGVLASPVGQSVSIKYHRLANATYDNQGLTGWNGSFFESIFLCDKYYIGALASADNKKFIFNGLLFLVDDATDIGIIETTV